jgi:3-oxoacyl-[acyl-carrier protein] reductase
MDPPAGTNGIVTRSQDAADLDFAELSVGQTFSAEHCFDAESVDAFAALVGDYSPLHVDEIYAQEAGFSGRVVHGLFLASLFSRLVGMKVPGKRALYVGQDLRFRRPVFVGETVLATTKISAMNSALREIQLTTTILKADQSVAVSGTARVIVRGSSAEQKTSSQSRPIRKVKGQPLALVTGASRGIGAAIALRLASDGFVVAVNYKSNDEAARSVVDRIVNAGGLALPVRADIHDESGVEEIVSGLVSKFGSLDLLVNNAAQGYEMKTVLEMPWASIEEQFNASVRAPLVLCRTAFPYLRETGGSIVNIISQVVESQPPKQMLDYVIGKFGLLGLTRGLAVEWAAEGIRVNGVAPSLIETDMTSHLNDRVFKLEASKTPLRRLAAPEDVAAAVSYLASKDAAFLTGIVMPVTGGQVMR